MTVQTIWKSAEAEEPVLHTQRLLLRPPRRDDVDAIYRGLSDFGVASMLARVPSPYYRKDAVDWLAQVDEDEDEETVRLAIAFEDGGMIGQVSIERRHGRPVIGYWLSRSYWGGGIMTEALGAIIARFLAGNSDAALHSGVFVDNPASLHIQEKLGFRPVGVSQVYCLARGEMLDHVDTVLTAADFAGPPQ